MLAGVLGVLGIGYLAALVDARTPLLVADTQGVRIRLGRAWRGLPWGALHRVEHTPRRGLLRDGRLVMVVHNPARLLEELDGSAPPTVTAQPEAVRRVRSPCRWVCRPASSAGDDLTAALTALAGRTSRVVEVEATAPEPDRGDEPVERCRDATRSLVSPTEVDTPGPPGAPRSARSSRTRIYRVAGSFQRGVRHPTVVETTSREIASE